MESAQVNLASEQATVTYDPQQVQPHDLIAAVEQAGCGVISDQIELPITGMTCASCVNRVEKALKKTEGVLDASVNLATERATVTYAPGVASVTSLQAAVEAAGYGVIAPAQNEAAESLDVEAAARSAELADKRRKLIVALAFGLPLFLLAMARDFGLIAPWLTPYWAANEALMEAAGAHAEGVDTLMHYPARADILNWLFLALAIPVQFYSGRDFYVHAWQALKARTANMDTLIALGSSAAFFYSAGLLAFNLAGHVYFETAAVIIALILVGKYLEARAKSQTSAAIRALIGLQPKTARVLLGEAIVRGAHSRSLTLAQPEGFETLAGHGVRATVDGCSVLIGSPRLMQERGIDTAELQSDIARLQGEAKTAVVVAVDGQALALLGIADPVKPTSPAAIAALKRQGAQVLMLTGDNRRTAEAIAQRVGLEPSEVLAEVLPEMKASEVKRVQEAGQVVAMVGDGINDAPAPAADRRPVRPG